MQYLLLIDGNYKQIKKLDDANCKRTRYSSILCDNATKQFYILQFGFKTGNVCISKNISCTCILKGARNNFSPHSKRCITYQRKQRRIQMVACS